MSTRLCPSAPAKPGALLVGVVGAQGRVQFLRSGHRVDDEFLAHAGKGGPAETKFRFASPCMESGCQNWSSGQCGVIERLLPMLPPAAQAPECAIRPECRWFAQRGAAACHRCAFVVTDAGEPEGRALAAFRAHFA